MADYENPLIPEGINVSPTHPLKDFILLVAGISTLLIVTVLVLSLLAGQLARHIPFANEQALAASLGRWLPQPPESAIARQRQDYLQNLAERLAGAMQLPPNMPITVHYSPGQTVNAMATLGGHIVVFEGLIATLPSENALAMILAHEIAHIRHRDPLVALGRGFTVMLALASFAGVGDGALQQGLGSIGMLPILSFSRSQEEAADAAALPAVLAVYGHVGDAAAFFEKVTQQRSGFDSPTLLSTHPDSEQRIARIREFSARQAPTDVAPTPLPAFMKAP
jgi:predicted Zn-dependent protease